MEHIQVYEKTKSLDHFWNSIKNTHINEISILKKINIILSNNELQSFVAEKLYDINSMISLNDFESIKENIDKFEILDIDSLNYIENFEIFKFIIDHYNNKNNEIFYEILSSTVEFDEIQLQYILYNKNLVNKILEKNLDFLKNLRLDSFYISGI